MFSLYHGTMSLIKKFYATFYEGFKFQNQIKLLKHSKYLFIWSGRFQILKMNLRTSLIQVEGSDLIIVIFIFGIFM